MSNSDKADKSDGAEGIYLGGQHSAKLLFSMDASDEERGGKCNREAEREVAGRTPMLSLIPNRKIHIQLVRLLQPHR